jgi:hypothetical protein
VNALVANAEANHPGASPKALPAVPVDGASGNSSRSAVGGRRSPNRESGSDSQQEGLRAELGVLSDGGSTPRGSSEDLRAAQRGLGDATMGSGFMHGLAIAVPRTPERERERDILNS